MVYFSFSRWHKGKNICKRIAKSIVFAHFLTAPSCSGRITLVYTVAQCLGFLFLSNCRGWVCWCILKWTTQAFNLIVKITPQHCRFQIRRLVVSCHTILPALSLSFPSLFLYVLYRSHPISPLFFNPYFCIMMHNSWGACEYEWVWQCHVIEGSF